MERMTEQRDFVDGEKLLEIRNTTNRRALFHGLGIRKCEKRSKDNDWWGWSPFQDEKTPSFHMSEPGRWYDFSIREGGGVIELVQRLNNVDCYEAGRIILENGWGQENSVTKPEKTQKPPEFSPINSPIRQNLIPLLSEQGTHPEFQNRGISENACNDLGCGLLAKGRSPLKDRIVFQVRGIEETGGELKPVILSHIGRATSKPQAEKYGKWLFYAGFHKALELYNIDKLLLDDEAKKQTEQTGHVLVVEGAFDVAKCWEAGIKNVVAAFGSDISDEQIAKLKLIQDHTNANRFLLWFDRDKAGRDGQNKALIRISESGLKAQGFNWQQQFHDPKTGKAVSIAENITDPCDMNIRQLQWLRANGKI
jgi:DNA primase